MKLTLIQKIVIIIDILILASLPFIAGQGTLSVSNTETASPLSEAALSPLAKFKSYENTLAGKKDKEPVQSVRPVQNSTIAEAKKPAPKVLVAGESIGISKVEPTPAATAVPEAQPVVQSVPKILSDEAITFLGNCESGMTATRNSGNGYYGAFQFSISTWNSMGTGYERADLAPLEVQIEAVQRLVARSNIYGQFPACAQKMRSAGLI